MKVIVEWMDREVREYESVDKALPGADHVLRLYGYEVGGRAPIVAEIPLFQVREVQWKGAR